MADLADVETALRDAIAAALYPSGAATTTTPAPGLGAVARVYRGWPNAHDLDADLKAGVLNVTVLPRPGMARNTTRYQRNWSIPAGPAPTLTVAVSGQTVTFAGAAAPGQVAGLVVTGGTPSGPAGGEPRTAYPYRIVAGDTPASVAAALAAGIAGTAVTGPSLTVPATMRVQSARVVADAQALMEIRRQEQQFQITLWSPTPALRDAAAALLDPVLANTPWLALAGGAAGRLVWAGSSASDRAENDALYRRDLFYAVEYPTTLLDAFPRMLFGDLTLNGAGWGPVTPLA